MLLRSCDSVFTNVDLFLRKLIMFYPKLSKDYKCVGVYKCHILENFVK